MLRLECGIHTPSEMPKDDGYCISDKSNMPVNKRYESITARIFFGLK